jgi:molybdate transport system permease protein
MRIPRTAILLAGVAVAFVVLPVVGLAVRAPWAEAGRRLSSPESLEAIGLSLAVATAATSVALLLGVPLAVVLARTSFPGRGLIRGAVILPVVLPPVVAGVGLLTALGRRGLLGPALEAAGVSLPFSTAGAAVAAAFVAMPFLVLALEAGLRQVDERLESAAASMGASGWYVLRRVTLPLVAPQLAAGLVLTWARALGEFGATLMFAGNLRGVTQTLPLAVFEVSQTDPRGGILLSLLLVALSLLALVALRGRFLAR